jgi:hypothetical protein
MNAERLRGPPSVPSVVIAAINAIEFVLPAALLILKFCMKLWIDKSANWVDFLRALLAFPIDVAFLALSFGSALIYGLPAGVLNSGSLKKILTYVVLAVTVCAAVTFCCRQADDAFVNKRHFKMLVCGSAALFCSVVTLLYSLNVTEFVVEKVQ